jgi:ketosteroid isomerase-like protein
VGATADLVARAYAALADRDFDSLRELADPDFELDVTDRVLNPDTYRGEEGLRRFLAEVDELWESMDMNVERLVERGDEVLALLLVQITGRSSGLQLEDRIAQHWWARDGKLVRMRVRADQEAALAEFEAGG